MCSKHDNHSKFNNQQKLEEKTYKIVLWAQEPLVW